MGRKKLEDPRSTRYVIRINKKETGLLNDVRKMTGMSSAADILRTALERMYWEEMEKERRRKDD